MTKASKTENNSDFPLMGQMVKVHIRPLEDSQGEVGPASESLWATLVGPEHARLDNVPVCYTRYALGDIVALDVVNDQIWLGDVKERSGHSVLILDLTASSVTPWVKAKLDLLSALGCLFERGYRQIAVDVSSTEQQKPALQIAEQGEIEGLWHVSKGYWHA
jgi:hypothetical protein